MHVLEEYRRREAGARACSERMRAQRRLWLAAVCMAAALLVVVLSLPGVPWKEAWLLLLSSGLIVSLLRGLRARRLGERADRRANVYREGLDRASGRKRQTGKTGYLYAPPADGPAALFSTDLDMFGPHSLFGMLATTRTGWGEHALADLLLEHADAPTVRSRQAAVRELAPNVDLREAVALLGTSATDTAHEAELETWLGLPDPAFGRFLRPGLLGITLAWIAVLLIGTLSHWPGTLLWRNLLVLWGLQMLMCWRVRPYTLRELDAAKHLGPGLRLLREGLSLLKHEHVIAPCLLALQGRASADDGASKHASLRSLERTLGLVEQRETGWGFALGLFVAAGTQEALSLARWRKAGGRALQQRIRAWAEFEALVAVATYAAEGNGLVYPEVLDSACAHGARFEAEDLKHPLLAPETAVGNSLRLGGAVTSPEGSPGHPDGARFLLISGSNMAGKSTLLRAAGLGVVLTRCGAPVPARSLRLTALWPGASIAVNDSLAEGRSKFLAEVERLSAIVRLAKAHPGEVLFLVDEVLSGTNSADRRIAAEAVVHALIRAGAIGAFSTHDLALAEIAENPALRGRNMHMASANKGDPLAFDFLLKPGPNRESNALAIVHMLGLPLPGGQTQRVETPPDL